MHVVIITGASDGIGAELARQLAEQHGAQIALVLAARSADKLEHVAAACRRHGAQALVHPTDVSHEPACRALISAALRTYGRIDTLINNAGISAHALLDDVTDLSWYEHLFRINVWGSIWCTHAALPHLKASRGRIVALSSLAGLVGVPGRTAYCTSKYAMNGFFEALRVELLPHGVSVTLAYPGVVTTEIRSRGLNAQGQPLGVSSLDERGAMPVDTCAQLIIEGMDRRQREVVMTLKGKLSRWMKLIAPQLVDRMALAALSREVHPQ